MPETSLQEYLAAAFEHLKSHDETLSQLLNEVSALREALLEAGDERFLELFEKHLEMQKAKIAGAASVSTHIYDEIIQRVKAGKMF